jgi:hypothetical protein
LGARLIFWAFSLLGMYGLKAIKEGVSWLIAVACSCFIQTLVHLLVTQFSGVTSYPFAMGWSETSRFYYPSLFLSEKIFGVRLPWPILHPSLHLLLAPPYWFDAPLWFHRFWQVFLRFTLLGVTAQALIWRLPSGRRFSLAALALDGFVPFPGTGLFPSGSSLDFDAVGIFTPG